MGLNREFVGDERSSILILLHFALRLLGSKLSMPFTWYGLVTRKKLGIEPTSSVYHCDGASRSSLAVNKREKA